MKIEKKQLNNAKSFLIKCPECDNLVSNLYRHLCNEHYWDNKSASKYTAEEELKRSML